MLTSEAAIKAIIESVIKKSQSSLELEEQITTGPGENISDTDPDLTKGINLQDTGSAQSDLEEDCNSSLGANNAENQQNLEYWPQFGSTGRQICDFYKL